MDIYQGRRDIFVLRTKVRGLSEFYPPVYGLYQYDGECIKHLFFKGIGVPKSVRELGKQVVINYADLVKESRASFFSFSRKNYFPDRIYDSRTFTLPSGEWIDFKDLNDTERSDFDEGFMDPVIESSYAAFFHPRLKKREVAFVTL